MDAGKSSTTFFGKWVGKQNDKSSLSLGDVWHKLAKLDCLVEYQQLVLDMSRLHIDRK